MKEIVSNLIKVYDGRDIPVILFTKNGGQWLNQIADAGAHATVSYTHLPLPTKA